MSYGAAKAALENYTMSASTELAPFGITANVVHPPVTDTGWVTDDVRAFVAASPDHHHVAAPAEVGRGHRLAVHRRRPPRHRQRHPPPVTARRDGSSERTVSSVAPDLPKKWRRRAAPCHGRLRPYWSWLDTQSPAMIALDSDVSPASTTAAQISANFFTFPLPKQPSISRHSRWVANPVPPP